MTIGFGDFVPGNSYIYSTSDSVSQVHTFTYIIYYFRKIPKINKISNSNIRIFGTFQNISYENDH